jgi:hypothetical protein
MRIEDKILSSISLGWGEGGEQVTVSKEQHEVELGRGSCILGAMRFLLSQ